MKTLCFTLSMPGAPSWNGRWSGEGSLYAVLKRVKDETAAKLDGQYFDHAWPDGWRAGIDVRVVAGTEIRRIRKKSCGFCGYDWMVDNILRHGSAYDVKEATK